MIAETLDRQETLQAVLHSLQLYGQHLSNGSAYDLTTNIRSLVKRAEVLNKSLPELRWKVDLTWSDWGVNGDEDRVRLVREDGGNVESNTFTTQCNSDVNGMVSYHNHVLIVHCDHDKLYVYDERGRLKRSVQVYSQKTKCKMVNPYDMCLVHGERDTHSLVISDHNGQCLWWVTTEEQGDDVKIGQPQQQKLKYKPSGVGTDRSGRAMVADYGERRVYACSHPGRHCTRL